MRTQRFKYLTATLAALAITVSGSSEATTIASVKAMGMGGAAVALGQDTITTFYNPANACSIGCRTDVGVSTIFNNRLQILSHRPFPSFQHGEFHAIRNWDVYGEAGWNTLWDCCGTWAFAIQWNNYEQVHTHYPTPLSDFSNFNPDLTPAGTRLKFNYRVEVLTTTVAYSFCNWLTFGVAANAYFSWLDVKGLEFITALSADPANVTNRTPDLAQGVGVTVGVLAKYCCDCVAIGFAYSPRVDMSKFKKYTGFLADGKLDIPETFRAGLSLTLPNQCQALVMIAVDGEYRRYSQIPSWANNFPGHTPGPFEPLFGTPNGPGFGWQDQWIGKAGINVCLNQYWTLRCGYRYEKSPIPSNGGTNTALNTLTLDTVEDYVTAGFTVYPDDRSEVSAFAEYGFPNSIKSRYPRIGGGLYWEDGDVLFKSSIVALGLSYGAKF